MKTNIAVDNDLWKELNKLREEPSDTFNEIIWRLIKKNKRVMENVS